MAEEIQSWPLNPSRLNHRSDEENPVFNNIRKERSNKCFVYVFTAIVLQSIFILVFALVVLRPKSPSVKLRSVTVKSLRYTTSPLPSLNATLVAEISIKNPNFGSFKFENSAVSFLYEGKQINGKKTVKGNVSARETKRFNVSVEVRSSRLSEKQNLVNDLNSGIVKLSSLARIVGKVHLIKILKTKKTKEMNCTMSINLKNRTIKDLLCN
ncbi:late embryogenesis abundant protein At1g64065 [Ziziphus jujuba]|uniref:Late embryogenesis abundant protein At1g64065 n=1 Tax=Ziziphus jujuba TaxID=326968 RepID=A0A6P4BC62_ZIZJJ|nr:late embryogenesis abundant protein At1g64065 [Ziziphus jujuba]